MEDISNSLKRQLEFLSDHKSLRAAARNKAIKILANLQETLKRQEILNFIENQDLKFAKVTSSSTSQTTVNIEQEENEHKENE
ncbi:15571_t:CDS:2, partial [Racocetra fulgida]